MKKILLVILTVSASFMFNRANAQWCGDVSHCTGNPLTAIGFEIPDSIPCAIQGVPYNNPISFQMYSTFTYLGVHQLDSITVDTIYNLPCGLCWAMNKASRTYLPQEFGCINVSGTTSDAVGQYNLRIVVTAYLNGGAGQGQTIYPSVVDAAGIKIWQRVASSGGKCTSVDTSAGAANQVAAAVCPNSINEVAANVASVSIVPNPTHGNAVLSFIANKIAEYKVELTDIAGRIVSGKAFQVHPGLNSSVIEKGNLSSGMYMVSLTDGVSSVTKKFTVVE